MEPDINREAKSEIEKALLEFELTDPQKKGLVSRAAPKTGSQGMSDWVVNHSRGIVKEKEHANYVLVGFVLLALIASFAMIIKGGPDIPEGALKSPEYGLPQPD